MFSNNNDSLVSSVKTLCKIKCLCWSKASVAICLVFLVTSFYSSIMWYLQYQGCLLRYFNSLDAQSLHSKPTLKIMGRLVGQKLCVDKVCPMLIKFAFLKSSWKIVWNIYLPTKSDEISLEVGTPTVISFWHFIYARALFD